MSQADDEPEHDPHITLRTAGPPRQGGVLGRYQLLEMLGHGAMATVFRARDTQLGRLVAVKVMTLAVAARTDSAERFRREAQAVAAVKHPGIVEIFDFVPANPAAGEPAYIVSELINGPTLGKFLAERRGRLLPETAALLAIPLAEALDAAHARGVVHRDIKPDNVMLERTGPVKRVVLTDFGVAHVTGLETMTATGALVGSPSYMSPEQARGEEIGPASDLFSLGILLYEMATGHLPFSSSNPLVLLAAICRGTFRRPSQVSPFAGPAFDEICARCLRVAPAERPARAGVVAQQLRELCAGAGLRPESLAMFLEDPEGFETALRPKLADAAVASARKHMRRGELARALAELSRATAYVPGHPVAERLCATISSRKRWTKAAVVLAAVGGIGAAAWTLGPGIAARFAAMSAPPASVEVAPAPPAPAPASVPSPEVKPAAVTAAEKPVEAPVVAAATTERRTRQRRPARKPEPAPETATTAPVVEEAPVPAPPPPEPAPANVTPPAVALPPPDVAVVIYAELMFCDPGLGDKPAQKSPARYTVKAGVHKVHCTPPGGKRWTTELRIGPPRAGGEFRVQLRKNAAGQPFVDANVTSKIKDE